MRTPHGNDVVGIDEAGRGPLAGPVVAAACMLTQVLTRRRGRSYPTWSPRGDRQSCVIGDSKCLTKSMREDAYAWLIAHCPFGVGMSSAEEVDRNGILQATEHAMMQALNELRSKIHGRKTSILIDGRDGFLIEEGAVSIVRGDRTQPTIAAASIIAKVSRDRWMVTQRKLFPAYGFERHKGYGSAEHLAALTELGPCALHRASFLRKFRERAARAGGQG